MSKQSLTIPISLDIDQLNEEAYDLLLDAFRAYFEVRGIDPDKFLYDQWRITCVAEARADKT